MLFDTATPVVAVDVANLVYRAFYIHKHLAYRGQPTGHIFGFLRSVLAFAKAHPGCEWWWAIDGHQSDRRQIDPEYKANRTHADLPISITDDIRDRVLSCLPGISWFHPSYEADDLLAQMVRSTQRPITVWSNDRDLWTCLRCKHASVFNGKDFVDNSVVRAYYGVRPAQIPLIKAVYGDSSDHIKSSGSRMLRDNFVSILNSHDVKTISELAAVLPNIEPDLSARLQRVWPAIQRNYRLVRLRSKPDPKVIRQRGPSTPEALVALLETTGCKSLLRDLDRTWSLFVLPACA